MLDTPSGSLPISPTQVRKLWFDYNEAKAAIDSPFGSSTTSAGSHEGDGFDADTTASPPNPIPSSSSIAAGQGPVRALRAFVDAVDLADARQTAVLQNLVRLRNGHSPIFAHGAEKVSSPCFELGVEGHLHNRELLIRLNIFG